MKKSESEPYARPTEQFSISSLLHTTAPLELQRAAVQATDTADPLLEDFTHGWRDWYTLSADNPYHWEYSSRKLSDPKWQGQTSQWLTIEVQAEQPNELVIVLTENFFRSYRGPQKECVAVAKLNGGGNSHTISLEPGDFKTGDGEALALWQNVDVLSLRAYYEKDEKLFGSKNWAGSQPVFRKLWWSSRTIDDRN